MLQPYIADMLTHARSVNCLPGWRMRLKLPKYSYLALLRCLCCTCVSAEFWWRATPSHPTYDKIMDYSRKIQLFCAYLICECSPGVKTPPAEIYESAPEAAERSFHRKSRSLMNGECIPSGIMVSRAYNSMRGDFSARRTYL